MRSALFAACALMALNTTAHAQTAEDNAADPYIWLEDKDGAKPLEWVKAQNAVTTTRLEADPRYQGFYDEALAILSAKDRIPAPSFLNDEIYNFWTDETNPRGLWRKTSLESYRSGAPIWTTVLDVDALGKAEGKSWVFKGADCLEPEQRLCLISLSEGGEDATTIREFDLATAQFVEEGFVIPRAKTSAEWVDADTLLLGTDWTGDGRDLTSSGYPYVVKRLRRGQALADAVEVFRGEKDDVAASASVLKDAEGNRLILYRRATDFFHDQTFVDTPRGIERLAIPERATPEGLLAGRLLVKLEEPWAPATPGLPGGVLISLDAQQVTATPASLTPTLVWAPGPRDALEAVSTTKNRLLLSTLDNVRGRVWSYVPTADGGWTRNPLAMPDNLALTIGSTDEKSDRAFLYASGFLTPTTLSLADAGSGAIAQIMQQPAKFDASGHVVEQLEATSSDGVKIPYFLVRPKAMAADGSTPTLMTAYGGFQVSRVPGYSATTGKSWLERGGAFVLANIRGGGEFGPAWHEAGLGVKRQIIYDDFAAVARDLVARKITSPEHLGIYGGSNGGLLMGVQMIQNPQMFGGVAIQIPLLDMIRISKIAAGASWQGEYGDVNADPAVMAFWRKTSPYQVLSPDGKYPEPFIFTTTRDDRTGPQHARKFAARMAEYGLPYYYYETTEGGHGTGADLREQARTQALTMTYFANKLMD